jgi:hypothetical protein
VWLIFLLGYFIFFAGAAVIISLKSIKSKLLMVGVICAVPMVMNVIGGCLGWVY